MSDDQYAIDTIRAGGDARRAFADLYDRYVDRVHAYCRRAMGAAHPYLDDVVQTVFIGLYDAIVRGVTFTSVPGYIFRSARHACISQLQRPRHDVVDTEQLAAITLSYERKELLDLIDVALQQLPEDYRDVFILREQMGLRYGDIGEALSMTPESARTRAYRARIMMRDLLAPYLRDLELNERRSDEP